MPTILAIWGPLFHLLRIQGGLGVVDRGTIEPGGFPGDGIITFRVGEIVVVKQPQAGAGTSGAPRSCNSGFINISFVSLTPDKL